jgi:NIPSNAP
MRRNRWLVGAAVVLAAGLYLNRPLAEGGKNVENRVFEMRTYYAHPGKMAALHARFRDHTTKLFDKHGMTNIGYWVDVKHPDEKLIYILAFPSKAAAEKAWKGFGSDPDWKKAKADSEVNGPLVARYESVYMDPTDYSKIK